MKPSGRSAAAEPSVMIVPLLLLRKDGRTAWIMAMGPLTLTSMTFHQMSIFGSSVKRETRFMPAQLIRMSIGPRAASVSAMIWAGS